MRLMPARRFHVEIEKEKKGKKPKISYFQTAVVLGKHWAFGQGEIELA